MRLPKTDADLRLLSEYLVLEKEMPGFVSALKIEHDPKQDEQNQKDPRAFCYVRPDNLGTIYCAANLEQVLPEVRMGILIHEIGHIVLDAFNGEESEVDVDAWIESEIPEAGYTYENTGYTRFEGGWAMGKNVQRVLPEFVRMIHGRSPRYL